MWPLMIAIGVKIVCEGIQTALDENREKNLRLGHQPRKQLNNGQFNGGNAGSLADCYEEIEQGVCGERY